MINRYLRVWNENRTILLSWNPPKLNDHLLQDRDIAVDLLNQIIALSNKVMNIRKSLSF